MKLGCEAKTDANLVQPVGNRLGIRFDSNAQYLQHVRRTSQARGFAVSMLGDGHATSSRHDGDRRADVEGPAAAPSGAASIEQQSVVMGYPRHVASHGPGGPNHFADRFPFLLSGRAATERFAFRPPAPATWHRSSRWSGLRSDPRQRRPGGSRLQSRSGLERLRTWADRSSWRFGRVRQDPGRPNPTEIASRSRTGAAVSAKAEMTGNWFGQRSGSYIGWPDHKLVA